MRAVLLAVACVALGCTEGEAAPYSAACGGAPPAFEDCASGLLHADCGGDAEPVLACAELGVDCRWFTGGCVAEGFRPIDCPTTDVCCVPTDDGMWAFEDGWLPEDRCAAAELAEELAFVSSVPSSATASVSLTVAVDPSVSSASEEWLASVECDGIEIEICRDGRAAVGRSVQRGDSFVVVFRPHLIGHAIYVEADALRRLGRIASRYQNDACPESRLSCDRAHAFPYELSGRLTIAATGGDPAESDGVLEVADPAGGTMRITF